MEVVKYMDGPLACFSRVKLASGEQVMVSIASRSVKVFRMALGGLLPVGTLWECRDWVRMGLMFRCGHQDRSKILEGATALVMLSPSAAAVRSELERLDAEHRGWKKE
ncbi:MAG TPA: hypothetical protein VFX98_06445 [Longimicrobiaceae bacterium]|nr:hypothetical protein [Longimicrobiaceae bacterium]